MKTEERIKHLLGEQMFHIAVLMSRVEELEGQLKEVSAGKSRTKEDIAPDIRKPNGDGHVQYKPNNQ